MIYTWHIIVARLVGSVFMFNGAQLRGHDFVV
jgi:hypothetical protein